MYDVVAPLPCTKINWERAQLYASTTLRHQSKGCAGLPKVGQQHNTRQHAHACLVTAACPHTRTDCRPAKCCSTAPPITCRHTHRPAERAAHFRLPGRQWQACSSKHWFHILRTNRARRSCRHATADHDLRVIEGGEYCQDSGSIPSKECLLCCCCTASWHSAPRHPVGCAASSCSCCVAAEAQLQLTRISIVVCFQGH
jgi:hypothetical protein